MDYLEKVDHEAPGFGDFYDELPLWSAPFGLMLLEHVELRPGMTILDVGAGTGFLAIELAQRCGASAQVIAVDPWKAAIERLSRKLAHLGIDNVRPCVQDVAAIDLPGESVDLVVSNLGLNNFDNPEAALRACFRVAKPGANLFLTTNLVGHMAEFYDVYRSVLSELGEPSGTVPFFAGTDRRLVVGEKGDCPPLCGRFTDRLAALDAHINHRATVNSVREQLEHAGFQFVTAATRTFRERFADGSSLLRHHFIRLGFLPGWISVAPADAIESTFAALERRLNSLAAQRGELSLTIPAACIQARKPVES
jgi:ubiquinone/menaquinone biosynthesis C-methylase UbiE